MLTIDKLVEEEKKLTYIKNKHLMAQKFSKILWKVWKKAFDKGETNAPLSAIIKIMNEEKYI